MGTNTITGAIFLDIHKALDTVVHRIILSNVKKIKPCMVHKWLTSYLNNWKQAVDFKEILSSSAEITITISPV